MMEGLLSVLGPVVIGALTVPFYGWLKQLLGVLDTAPAFAQQLIVLSIAAGLTWLSGTLGVVLPTDLALWTPDTTEMALSAGMAFAIHAGKKAKK